MSAVSRLKYVYLAFAAKPKNERFLYRAIHRQRTARITVLGLASLPRCQRLIEVAQRFAPQGDVSFTAIDEFEDRPSEAASDDGNVSLIDVFRQLRPTGAHLRLLPGSIDVCLPDVANSLTGTDLLMIGPQVTDAKLAATWFYFPRMLHAGSVVLHEQSNGADNSEFRRIDLPTILALATKPARRAA